jgi:aminomethyltransferase
MTLRESPLAAEHVALGANLVEFGGWRMPIAYPSGTIEEHLACRRAAAMFDVSHLGTVRVEGPGARSLLQRTLTNDLDKVGPGRAQYTHLLDEGDASVLDDIIVWWHPGTGGTPDAGDAAADVFDVMPNASNTERVRAALGGTDTTATRAVIAVQGPAARDRVRSVLPEAADVGRFRVARCVWRDADCTVAGTGYTGEPGIEIAVPAPVAADLWRALLHAGVVPAGLGARDTLRLEAGLPLHGHELGPGITSLQAGLGWVVAWDKPEFQGRDAAVAERARGVRRRLVGISTEGRRPARAGCPVRIDGAAVGEVTSGNYAPSLGHGIALAFVPPATAVGQPVVVDVRGKDLPGVVVMTPFER